MGHWYLPTGEAHHFQENGKPTTLREARKVGAFPSVTTIIGILDKPALTGWKLKQVTGACYEDSQLESGSSAYNADDKDAYHKDMVARAFEESTGQRDRGSEIHDALEDMFNQVAQWNYPADITDIACEAFNAIVEYCDTRELIPEQTVVGDGYGGMVDLHNDDFVIDWKTKDIQDGQTGKYLAWPEMAMQLAAYDQALGGSEDGQFMPPYRRCINVFIDRTEPGKVVIHEWEPEQIELAWEKFQLLVKFWQLDKNYFPGAA